MFVQLPGCLACPVSGRARPQGETPQAGSFTTHRKHHSYKLPVLKYNRHLCYNGYRTYPVSKDSVVLRLHEVSVWVWVCVWWSIIWDDEATSWSDKRRQQATHPTLTHSYHSLKPGFQLSKKRTKKEREREIESKQHPHQELLLSVAWKQVGGMWPLAFSHVVADPLGCAKYSLVRDESSNPVVKRFDTTSYERASRFFLYARTFDIVLFAEPSCWWER